MKKLFYTSLWLTFWLPIKILWPTKVLGKRNRPRGRQIAISNHLSWKDIPVTGIGVRGFRRFFAKKEIGRNPLIRLVCKLAGVIFVDRGKADLSAIRASVAVLKKGGGLHIYPESHRNRLGNTELQEVKSGAAMIAIKGKAPLMPVIIYNKPRLFRRNYIYVGRPFELTEYYGRKLDTPALEAAASEVSRQMKLTQAVLRDSVANKRWKRKNRLSTDELYAVAKESLAASSNSEEEA